MCIHSILLDVQEDYTGFNGSICFPLGSSQNTHISIVISTVLDNISEGSETFVIITNVTTVCQFELGSGVSTITIQDRESKFYD